MAKFIKHLSRIDVGVVQQTAVEVNAEVATLYARASVRGQVE